MVTLLFKLCYQVKEPIQKYFYISIDKPFNPLVNSGAISSTALLLNREENKDKSSEAMSTTYELIHGCIKVNITIFTWSSYWR